MVQEIIYPIPPDVRNAGDNHQDSASKVPAQARAFTAAAVQLRELKFPKTIIFQIVKHSNEVADFIEALAALRKNDIDESVFLDIIRNSFGEEI
jgi:hypothetical protein